MSSPSSFSLFTSLRYDTLLRESEQNSSETWSFSPASPFYMLRYHRDRMLEAAQHFEWDAVAQKLADGKELELSLDCEVRTWRSKNDDVDAPLKVRVLFNRDGAMQTDIIRTAPVALENLFPSSFSLPTPPPSKPFTPSPKTGGALNLGPDGSVVASNVAGAGKSDWILTLDTHPTPSSPHTLLKTTYRAHYDASRSRSVPVTIKDRQMHEVVLWNEVNEIMEGSFTSVYLYRGGRWVTPPVGHPKNVPVDEDEKKKEDEQDGMAGKSSPSWWLDAYVDEGELREPFPGRWGHSVRSEKVDIGSGGQRGTTRRWALKAGLCMEEPIHKDTVQVGEQVWVSNGVRGFGLGTVAQAKKQK